VDGFRCLRRAPLILGITLIKGAGTLVWGAVNVLVITIAHQIFPLSFPWLERLFRIEDPGAATLGIIYVMVGLGTGVGLPWMCYS
jgi:hypothetical protein